MDDLRRLLGMEHAASVAALNFTKTLHLLRALKAGAVCLDQVQVTGDSWNLLDVVEPPAPAPAPEPEPEAA